MEVLRTGCTPSVHQSYVLFVHDCRDVWNVYLLHTLVLVFDIQKKNFLPLHTIHQQGQVYSLPNVKHR